MLNDKKILLVHPLGYRAGAAGQDISRIANIMPPLGLASIAAYLERRGTGADIVDCYARPDSDRVIRDYLLAEKPAFIGLSCTTSSFHDGSPRWRARRYPASGPCSAARTSPRSRRAFSPASPPWISP